MKTEEGGKWEDADWETGDNFVEGEWSTIILLVEEPRSGGGQVSRAGGYWAGIYVHPQNVIRTHILIFVISCLFGIRRLLLMFGIRCQS